MNKRLLGIFLALSIMLSACGVVQGALNSVSPNTPTQDATMNAVATEVSVMVTATAAASDPYSQTLVETEKVGNWTILRYTGVTAEMEDWFFNDLSPADWPEFPNVDNDVLGVPASQGLEYGEDLSVFCQYKETCDFVVPAMHYRIYSGDYSLDGVGGCTSAEGVGCALMVVNVGTVTASFEDQMFDAGFTVAGRYWDGAFLPQAIWAGLSHVSNNMLNMDSTLNPATITNAGANCSVPGGCESVEATFVVISGNQILMIGRQVVSQ